MKRTKENYYTPHPHFSERAGVSGLQTFDGEDAGYDTRSHYYQQQQRQWIDQQKNEKAMINFKNEKEEAVHSKQIGELNKMRIMLDEDFKRKKQVVNSSLKDENLILAQTKKDKEAQEKAERLRQEREDLRLLNQRGRNAGV